ncbi:hypothetical protein HIM_11636 [Hirsutella minnesotensis 3608]|uniref:ribonuclease H n=1 Tax=Hirsutella minnesotensis 3608 TaxID=1043627 RepID=A0A0F8A0Y4_9HYPO|nr:hypothetical protein HIM_11636 [Hirsutella minnesotensis 3608]
MAFDKKDETLFFDNVRTKYQFMTNEFECKVLIDDRIFYHLVGYVYYRQYLDDGNVKAAEHISVQQSPIYCRFYRKQNPLSSTTVQKWNKEYTCLVLERAVLLKFVANRQLAQMLLDVQGESVVYVNPADTLMGTDAAATELLCSTSDMHETSLRYSMASSSSLRSLSYHRTVNVYTDGACSSNGTPSAIAGIGIYVEEEPHREISECIGEEYPQTNQAAELLAISRALEEYKGSEDIAVQWSANNWKKADGRTPANVEIIKDIVNIIKVHGHASNIGNNKADQLAQQAVKKGRRESIAKAMRILEYVENADSSDDTRYFDVVYGDDAVQSSPLAAMDEMTAAISDLSPSLGSPAPLSIKRHSDIVHTVEDDSRIPRFAELQSISAELQSISAGLNTTATRLNEITAKLLEISSGS